MTTFILRKIIARNLFLLTLIFYACSLHAQHELYSDSGTLYLGKNALLHVEGEIENQSGATLQNDGVIEITGDFTNNVAASFTKGTDTTSTERAFKFIGNATQTVKGNLSNTTSRYFYNLIIDKSVSGTFVQMQSPVTVSGSLVFGSATTGADTYTSTAVSTTTNNSGKGIIKTFDTLNNDYELFVSNASVNAVKGYATLTINGNPTDGYIQNRGAQGVGTGGFARNVSTTDVPYVFPVATGTNGYNAAALTFTVLGANPDKVRNMFVDAQGGVGSLSQFCSGCGNQAPDNTGFNYLFNTNACNANTEQWIILDALPLDHGYWSYSGNAGDKYFIETYPNSFNGFAGGGVDSWRTIKKSGSISAIPSGDWTEDILRTITDSSNLLTYTKNAGCYSRNGIPGGIYTGFSHFQMARTSFGNALPVELLYLSANAIDNKLIRLKWATALEINNNGFEVLRSNNGIDFEKIGWQNAVGNGNNTTQSEYSFDDVTALPNVLYYYKLNQTDNDGAIEETYLVNARLTSAEGLQVGPCYPNPADGISFINIQTPSALKLSFALYDLTGQLINQSEINASSGNFRFNFNTSNLPQGSYRTVIKSLNQVFTNTLHIIR